MHVASGAMNYVSSKMQSASTQVFPGSVCAPTCINTSRNKCARVSERVRVHAHRHTLACFCMPKRMTD